MGLALGTLLGKYCDQEPNLGARDLVWDGSGGTGTGNLNEKGLGERNCEAGLSCPSLIPVSAENNTRSFPSLLTEQYESFVKFTHDQIMRRYGTRPTSCKYCQIFLEFFPSSRAIF